MDLPTLEIVFRIRFFDGLATVERSVVHGSRPNRVLSIERGNGRRVVLVDRRIVICCSVFGSIVPFCWAKAGKTIPVASPTKANSLFVFIVSSQCFIMVVAENPRQEKSLGSGPRLVVQPLTLVLSCRR